MATGLTRNLFKLFSGVLCIVSANVPTMAGGAMNEVSALKAGRIHQIAMQNRLPTITLTQSVRVKENCLLMLAY